VQSSLQRISSNFLLWKRNDWVRPCGPSSTISEALSNGAIPKLNFLVPGRISVVMSKFSVFGLSYERFDNELYAEEGQYPIFDPLPRNEKLCGNL